MANSRHWFTTSFLQRLRVWTGGCDIGVADSTRLIRLDETDRSRTEAELVRVSELARAETLPVALALQSLPGSIVITT